MKIQGGYYIKARKIQESDIAHAPPHVREIWDLLLKNANHAPRNGIERGQLFTTYEDILKELSWFVGYRKMGYKKHHCEIAMKWLLKRNMIATAKTTRGILITVVNYETYQNPDNYESHTRATANTTMKLLSTDTIHKNVRIKEEEQVGTPFCQFVLKDSSLHPIYEDSFPYWKKLFPELDIPKLHLRMAEWTVNTPAKRKTKSGVRRFILNWLTYAEKDRLQNAPKTEIKYVDKR